jgi:hypothetical protein
MRSKCKQNDQHTDTVPPAASSETTKLNDNEKSAEKYRTLTKKVGKIPKKPQTP